jgi:glucose/arabinose dehydrogenase
MKSVLAVLLTAAAIVTASVHAVPLKTVRVAQLLNFPIYATSPPGDVQRLFIVEQAGKIKILKNGTLLTRPFLDIVSQVNSGEPEQGLLGLAFPPDYATSGYFYVYFTAWTGPWFSAFRRFKVSSIPDSADASTIHRILDVTQPQTNHNGGHIAFGPDGFLWIGLGDGGAGGGPAQDGNSLLGKMLRIDVNADDFPADTTRNYAIPDDNPFVGDPLVRDEIWAMGLRNPYRWSFDRLTEDLIIGDVGQLSWEELDFQPASSNGGENYGWPLMEGNHCFNPPENCDDGNPVLTYPIHEYGHIPPAPCWSITGGYVYRGQAMPALQGTYFFADYCLAKIWTAHVFDGGIADTTDRTLELDPPDANISNVAAFAEDAAGELYIVERASITGEVFKIVPNPAAVDAPTLTPTISNAIELGAGHPNPTRERVLFALHTGRAGQLLVRVLDARGRVVRNLDHGWREPHSTMITWDTRDEHGVRLPPGVYFLEARLDDQRIARPQVIIR